MRTVMMVLAIILWLGTSGSALDLSTDVYPSEDELLEALRRGDLDEERYLILIEILREGIDSSSVHLFDEIPGLTGRGAGMPDTKLTNEQAEPFLPQAARRRGSLEHRYAHELERDGRGVYRTTLRVHPTERIDLSLRVDRSLSGRERLVGRTVRYRDPKGVVREMVLGSFTRRFGLGTIIGYRGKLMGSSEHLDGESFLYPDYGGENGMYGLVAMGRWRIEGLLAQTRDEGYTLAKGGVYVHRPVGRFEVGVIAGGNRLRNRATGGSIGDFKYGVVSDYRYRRGEMRAEVSAQAGERESFGAAVLDGRHRLEGGMIRYTVWHYDRAYLDLSGGSKAGPISAYDSLASVEFRLRSRRSGATGAVVRTTLPLAARWHLEHAGVLSGLSRDSLRGELLTALVLDLSAGWQVRGDLLTRLTRRRESPLEGDGGLRRARLEARYARRQLVGRTSVSHTVADAEDYLSLFTRIRYEATRLGRLEVWANLGRISMKRWSLDYSYSYVRCAQPLVRGVDSAVKVAHRYSRTSSARHLTTVTLEVSVVL